MSKGENEIFKTVSRQTLRRNDAVWLVNNLRESSDWPFWAQKAFEEGIAPFLYYQCRNLDVLDKIPKKTKKFLARIYAETFLINTHRLKAMADLENALNEWGLKVIIFKGAALLQTVYRDVALRPMEDIDLMVRREDLACFQRLLKKKGFVQSELYPDSFVKGILAIDVHLNFIASRRIRSREDILNIPLSNIWNSAVPINGSPSLYRPSLNDQLIAFAFHLLKHRYERLIWLVDIAESIETYASGFDWRDLMSYSRRVHAERLLLYALLMTKHLLGGNIPDEVLNGLGRNDLSQLERYILRLRLKRVPLGTVTDLLWMFQIREMDKKIGFIKENIFPRREIMHQIYPDSSYRFNTLLKRARMVSLRILSDLLTSLAGIMKGNLPPL